MFKAIKRQPRDMPWYPEWTKFAACAKYSIDFVDEIFFDYGNNGRRIAMAKRICAQCPVIHKCREQNRFVPMGIFFGMTAIERWRWNGLKGYPNSNKVGFNTITKRMA